VRSQSLSYGGSVEVGISLKTLLIYEFTMVFHHLGMLAFLEKVQLKYHQKVGPLLNIIERQIYLLNME
jgi:hypothetical protein